MRNFQLFPLLCGCVFLTEWGRDWLSKLKDPHFGVLNEASKNHTTHFADNHPV